MRLRVKHVSLDNSYDRSLDIEFPQKMKISSKNQNPFVLQVLVWPLNGSHCRLSTNTLRIDHRNAPFDAASILGGDLFNYDQSSPLDPKVITEFNRHVSQSTLSPEYRYHLGWILLRLLNKEHQHLEVTEMRTNAVNSFDAPPGYWHICIDRYR
jgi:hypothetical protein